MKTKFKHILVILCLSMISCEGNLEPELFDQITPENFLTNEDDVKTAVTGVYAEFRGISEWGRYKTSWGSVMTLQEVPTDLWAANWFYKAHTDFMWKATDYFVCEIFDFRAGHNKSHSFNRTYTRRSCERRHKKSIHCRIESSTGALDVRSVRPVWAGSGNHRPRKNTQSHSGLYGNSPLSGRYITFVETELKEIIMQNFACRMGQVATMVM